MSYVLQIEAFDNSLRNEPTFFIPEGGQRISINNGEILTLRGEIYGKVQTRSEVGWLYYPVKSKAKVNVVFKKGKELSDRKVDSLVLIFAIVRKSDSLSVRIPAVFPGMEKVPANFKNDIQGWNFSREYLEENAGKLLTLDLDFGEACSLKCPHCFRHNGTIDHSKNRSLSHLEIFSLIRKATNLGLESIKILGAGEPFENRFFLGFLQEMQAKGIKVNIFTKAHVLGDDALAQKYFNLSAEDLIGTIKDLDVSLNVGFNSFNPEIQDSMVGVQGYTAKRNRALELLSEAGFNQGQPTRLCLAIVPITKQNIHEIYEIYVWARERNIYPVTTVSMCAGRAQDSWQDLTPSPEELIALYTRINIYNIEKGISTLDELKRNDISSYAGGCPCHQVACGMYITSRGIVLRCPGDDTTIFGDVYKTKLKDIWQNSENYLVRRGIFNCHCPPKDGKSIPLDFYNKVLENVVRHFKPNIYLNQPVA